MTKKKEGSKIAEKNEEQVRKEAINAATLRSSEFLNSVFSIAEIYSHEKIDYAILSAELAKKLKAIANGNYAPMEDMLFTQAQVLQAVFHFAAMRFSNCENLPQIQTYSDLMIKTNNACRKTLQAISQIKHPTSTTFIKQQNNAVNQQINQGEPMPVKMKNSEISHQKPTNELLTEIPHATLDTRRETAPSNTNSKMAAMAKSRRKNT